MINAHERLNIYIEDYKVNSHNGLDRMKNYYDCEDEYWWVIEQLLDKYIDVDDKNKKAIEYIDNLRDESAERQEFYDCFPDDLYIPNIDELLDILKEDK